VLLFPEILQQAIAFALLYIKLSASVGSILDCEIHFLGQAIQSITTSIGKPAHHCDKRENIPKVYEHAKSAQSEHIHPGHVSATSGDLSPKRVTTTTFETKTQRAGLCESRWTATKTCACR
jgi:hypothetical protein